MNRIMVEIVILTPHTKECHKTYNNDKTRIFMLMKSTENI